MSKLKSILLSYNLSLKEQVVFAQRLSFLIKGGVPILESLRIIRNQSANKGRTKVYDSIVKDVSAGKFLYASMAKFKNVFGDFAINVIKVGETSGNLDQNLNYLAQELKKKEALRKKITGALVYPVLISIATIGLTSLLTIYILPKIMPIFTSLNVHLPFTTRALIWSSSFLRSYGAYLLVFLIVGFFVVRWLLRIYPRFRFLLHKVIFQMPLANRIIVSYNMANFSRTLGLLLKSGVRIVEALDTVSDTSANLVYKRQISNLSDSVGKGDKISKYLTDHNKYFPDIISQMILVGETSGNLSDALLFLSEYYESEVDDLTKNLSSSIEPILMVVMGIIVGFVAVSIITPIYEITQNLSK